jgi:hypothetical protein
MRYRVVANLVGGGRISLATFDESLAREWWSKVRWLDLAGPKAASLTRENREGDQKDVILEMSGAT